MSKITIQDLVANGAKGLSCVLMAKDSHHGGLFEGRVLNASGNGDCTAYDADPNAALQAAKELHMDFARRKAERPPAPPPAPKRTRKAKLPADDGMDLV